MNSRDLIESVFAQVRIVVCGRCNGLGAVGLPSMRTTCPDCGGSGETTNGVHVERVGVT